MRKIFLLIVAVCAFSFAEAQNPPPADTLKEYAGKYKFPEGTPFSEVAVVYENGMLTATSVAGSSELKRREGDTFDVVAYGGIAIFKRNEEKKVVRLQIQVNDIDAEGEKVDGSPSPQYPWQFKYVNGQ